MPFNGLTPFLLFKMLLAHLPSCVSMPFNGLHPFLPAKIVQKRQYFIRCQCPYTGLYHFYPALLEAPVYKGLKGAFSPRFFKLLQKCYILPVFLFFWILVITYEVFYHIFLIYGNIFLKLKKFLTFGRHNCIMNYGRQKKGGK